MRFMFDLFFFGGSSEDNLFRAFSGILECLQFRSNLETEWVETTDGGQEAWLETSLGAEKIGCCTRADVFAAGLTV